MGINCEILLKTPNKGTYGSGELVKGSLQYIVEKPVNLTYIKIFLEGKLKGKSTWTNKDQKLINKESFVSLQKTFQYSHEIQIGEYEQDFEFLLPNDIASSFSNKNCTISYKIIAEVKLSGDVNEIQTYEKELQVLGDVKPLLDERLIFGLTKTPFPSDKPIDLEVEIQNKFINAGENINLNYAIYNEAGVPVTSIKTKLISVTTYKYDGKKKKVQRKTVSETVVESPVCEVKFGVVVPTLRNLHSIQHSKFLKKEYKVLITATFPFPHTDSSVEIPIVISATKSLRYENS